MRSTRFTLLPRRPLFGSHVSGWPIWWAFAGWAAAVVASSLLLSVATGLNVTNDALRFAVTQSGLWALFAMPAFLASAQFGSGRIVNDFSLWIRPSDKLRALALGAIVQVVLPIVYLPVRVAGFEPDLSGPARDLFEGLSWSETFVVLVGVVAFAPLFEELLFRGVLLRALQDRLGTGSAIALSATLFGVTHLQVWQFPALVMIGAVLAWVAVRSGGLGFAIWTHVGFNATTAVVLLVS